jgi:hypothetical protein
MTFKRCEVCHHKYPVKGSERMRVARFCSRRCQKNEPKSRRIKRLFEKHVVVFWKYIKKTKSCWLWTGKLRNGYGDCGGHYTAPRISWMLHRGKIPKGKSVCHDCPGGDNPLCANPDHLFLASNAENIRDMWRKGRAKCCVFTKAQVVHIRKRHARSKETYADIARSLNTSDVNIRNIVLRITYKHIA